MILGTDEILASKDFIDEDYIIYKGTLISTAILVRCIFCLLLLVEALRGEIFDYPSA